MHLTARHRAARHREPPRQEEGWPGGVRGLRLPALAAVALGGLRLRAPGAPAPGGLRLQTLATLVLFLVLGCAWPAAGERAVASGGGLAGEGSGAEVSSSRTEGGEYLFVCVQDEAQIAVLDQATGELVHTIDLTELGYSERAQPHHVVVEPDGSYFYVTLIGAHRVVKFDREFQRVGEAPMESAGMLALDPSGDWLFVSRSMSAVNPPQRIGMIRRSTMEIEEVDIFFAQPHAMVVDREGRFAYSASLSANQLASLEVERERVTLTDVEGPTHAIVQFAISPDGRLMAGSGEMSGQLLVFDLAEDPARPTLVRSVEVGHMAFDPTFSPDGEEIWVPVKHTDEVVVVRAGTGEVVRRISGEGIDAPHQVVFSHDGRRAFVSNNNKNPHAMHGPVEDDGGRGTVVIVDTATGELLDVVRLGRNVTGIGARPLP